MHREYLPVLLRMAKKTKAERPTVHVTSVRMADGIDINSPEARERIIRALLGLPQLSKKPAGAEAVSLPDDPQL